MPCNFHLRALAAKVKEGIRAAGGTPMEFNTDRDLRRHHDGHEGMKASLVSREVIADSIELVAARPPVRRRHRALPAATRRSPARSWRSRGSTSPACMLYGGSIAPGHFQGNDVTIQDVFEAIGAHAAGQDDRRGARASSRPSPAPAPAPAAASSPPTRWRWPSRCSASRRWARRWCRPRTRRKAEVAYEAGELVIDVLKRGLRPSDIITREALENAIAGVAASGGSTNAVLHLLAVAREAGVELDIDDFDRISRAHAAAVRPQARRPLRRHRPLRGRRRPARRQRLQRGRPAPRGRDHRHRADDRRARRGGRRDRGPEGRARRSTSRSSRPAASRSCAATSRPRAASSSSPATSARTTRARRASSTARRRRWRPSPRARSRPATWSSSATRARPAAPACARCSP